MSRLPYCRPVLRELTAGVDALYLSAHSKLTTSLLDRLTDGREAAREAGSWVPFEFGGYDWRLQPHGLTRSPFRLDHELGVLGLSDSDRLPTFRFQARSEGLHSPLGPRGVVAWITAALANEGFQADWTVSRLDLHSDLQGWALSGNDRHRFVCRSRTLATYEEDGSFTGFTFGRRSSKTVNGRIYDKTREIAGNGHDWWIELWGPTYDPDQPVLRVEFELHRDALREMNLSRPTEVLDAADRLWAYVTTEWLTYRRPSAHERAARWPVSSQWAKIQRSALAGSALPIDRIRSGRTDGELRRLLPGLNGYVAGLASWIGVNTIADACTALPSYLCR